MSTNSDLVVRETKVEAGMMSDSVYKWFFLMALSLWLFAFKGVQPSQ